MQIVLSYTAMRMYSVAEKYLAMAYYLLAIIDQDLPILCVHVHAVIEFPILYSIV